MTVPAAPGVFMDFSKQWCARHLEPFRAAWPKDAGEATIRLFGIAVADDAFAILAGAGTPEQDLQRGIDRASPLCCFVGDDRLQAVYEFFGVAPPVTKGES